MVRKMQIRPNHIRPNPIDIGFLLGPCWVDEFGPPDQRTTWLSYLQSTVPFGIMFGYLVATLAVWVNGIWVDGTHPSSSMALLCWRWPFVLQTVLVTPLIIGLWITP